MFGSAHINIHRLAKLSLAQVSIKQIDMFNVAQVFTHRFANVNLAHTCILIN